MAESFPDYLSLVVQWLQPQAPKEDRKLALPGPLRAHICI